MAICAAVVTMRTPLFQPIGGIATRRREEASQSCAQEVGAVVCARVL